MRIISGQYKGRVLETPQNNDIRPTGDKVRGSVFNILRGHGVLAGAQVMDVFCGTGAMGLEALSQGAGSCIFIDSDRDSLNLTRRNVDKLGVEGCDFILHNAVTLTQRREGLEKIDLVFMDPPYHQDLVEPALNALHEGAWLAADSMVVTEVEKRFSGNVGGPYDLLDDRTYGQSRVLFLRYNPPV